MLAPLVIVSGYTEATIYTWVDDKGVTHYSQIKPNEVSVAEEIKIKQTNAFTFEDVKKHQAAIKAKESQNKTKQAKTSNKSSDECWKKGNSLGFLIAAADELSGKEKAEYVKMLSDQKRALEKECGKNSNAWNN
ncbi:DUF4124 domain-containing protein [Rheinheimera sp. NSM]|uniref:DUF4124 domain-containing protein n=1 Tax=Rheinheimera sp. NSM TaxID=3457884 RepID=UPI00403542B3